MYSQTLTAPTYSQTVRLTHVQPDAHAPTYIQTLTPPRIA